MSEEAAESTAAHPTCDHAVITTAEAFSSHPAAIKLPLLVLGRKKLDSLSPQEEKPELFD